MRLTHSLKAPGFNPCTYEVKTWFQASACIKRNFYRYIEEERLRTVEGRKKETVDTLRERMSGTSSAGLHAECS
jgi:hypothetical protein